MNRCVSHTGQLSSLADWVSSSLSANDGREGGDER